MKGMVICGAVGRMGRALIQVVQADPDAVLAGALEYVGHPLEGQDIGAIVGLGPVGVALRTSLDRLEERGDVLIDFSMPAPTLEHLAWARQHHRAIVIGTTGFSSDQLDSIRSAALEIPIVMSGNFSIGVNIALDLVERASLAFGPGCDVEIMEAHHRHKVDAPSGTALMLGEAVMQGREGALSDVAQYGRHGHTGVRPLGQIGMHSLRGGDVVGDHQVWFMAEGERLEIRHVAASRMNFAQGAIRAALWVVGRTPGLYSMRQVLGLI